MTVGLFALAWLAVLGLLGWLTWEQSRFVEISDFGLDFRLDIDAATRSEQILATIVLVALALPPLALLMFQFRRSRDKRDDRIAERERQHSDERYSKLENQVSELERRLQGEREVNRHLESDIERARPNSVSDAQRGTASEPHRSRRWRLPTGIGSRR
jgi:ABC-type multidrug transport system fused ATPase/permease subunit